MYKFRLKSFILFYCLAVVSVSTMKKTLSLFFQTIKEIRKSNHIYVVTFTVKIFIIVVYNNRGRQKAFKIFARACNVILEGKGLKKFKYHKRKYI